MKSALSFFLFASGATQLVLTSFSLLNHKLSWPGTVSLIHVHTMWAFLALASIVHLHLAFDLFNANLYRVSSWAYLIQFALTASFVYVERVVEAVSIAGAHMVVSLVGFVFLTWHYKKHVVLPKRKASSSAVSSASSNNEVDNGSPITPRSPRARSPNSSTPFAVKCEQCGGLFKSARGLKMHEGRVHNLASDLAY